MGEVNRKEREREEWKFEKAKWGTEETGKGNYEGENIPKNVKHYESLSDKYGDYRRLRQLPPQMALPAHSGPWPLIQFRNHFSQTV
jgi:hypothetical protein